MASKKRTPGAAIRRAIEKMDGADLIVLAANLANAYRRLPVDQREQDWAAGMEAFQSLARPALLSAFKVSKVKREAKGDWLNDDLPPSPSQQLAGLSGAERLSGMTFEAGKDLVKF